jgi:hypothetical protein
MEKLIDIEWGVMKYEVVYGARKKTERSTPDDVPA